MVALLCLEHTDAFGAQALPAVCNIGLLLMLLLYMYAVAGVILFKDIVPHGGITHMSNFKHFGYSCWTLFKICTVSYALTTN